MPKYRRIKPSPTKKDYPTDTGLTTSIVIYVPSTDASQKSSRALLTKRVKETQSFLTRTFGGTTKVSGFGTYTSKQGNVIGEAVAKVEVFTTPKTWNAKDHILLNWLKTKKELWGQESIGWEFEESMHFV